MFQAGSPLSANWLSVAKFWSSERFGALGHLRRASFNHTTSTYELFSPQLMMNKMRFSMLLRDDTCLVVFSITVAGICEKFGYDCLMQVIPIQVICKGRRPPATSSQNFRRPERARCRAIPRPKPRVPTGPKTCARALRLRNFVPKDEQISGHTLFPLTTTFSAHGGSWTVAVSCKLNDRT